MSLHRMLVSTAVMIVCAFAVPASVMGDALSLATTEEEITFETKIVSATIYTNRAQITRRGDVELARGRFRVVCEDLPKGFFESSILVEGTGSATARIVGIDLERREKREVDAERFTELTDQYMKLYEEYSELNIKLSALKRREELRSSISEFSLDKAQDQLARETFSIQQWKALLDFFEQEDVETRGQIESIQSKTKKMYEKMNWFRSELAAMRADDRYGKAVVIDCEVTAAGTLTFDIAYLVPNASWAPQYTIRYLEREQELELAYNATIGQSTGEDWKEVSVLLSTAKPHIGAAPPKLEPWYLSSEAGRIWGKVIDSSTGGPIPYANVVLVGTKMGSMTLSDGTYNIVGVPAGTYTVKVMMMGYRQEERQGIRVGAGSGTVANFALDEMIVGKGEEIVVEAEMPQVEVTMSEVHDRARTDDEYHVRGGRSGVVEARAMKPAPPPPVPHAEAEVTTSEFAANLQIEKSVDLETGAEPRRSLVVRQRFPGKFSRFSVPRLSKHVFVEGVFDNKLDFPLLPGMAEVYIETVPKGSKNRVSNFVGREPLDAVASGEEFTVHLGIDQDVKIDHELEHKEYLTKAGRKKARIRYGYLITVESFKDKPVEVSIVDRIPVSMMKEVKVEDVEILPPPVEEGEDGILTWKIPLGPGEKEEIRFAYTIEFPGDWSEDYLGIR
ncbi:MAG: mucoidy inhibitor MuiA family protein [bacterium]|nr:MAG: mucoidy inhibitor MuiA family protein [bacterium]